MCVDYSTSRLCPGSRTHQRHQQQDSILAAGSLTSFGPSCRWLRMGLLEGRLELGAGEDSCRWQHHSLPLHSIPLHRKSTFPKIRKTPLLSAGFYHPHAVTYDNGPSTKQRRIQAEATGLIEEGSLKQKPEYFNVERQDINDRKELITDQDSFERVDIKSEKQQEQAYRNDSDEILLTQSFNVALLIVTLD